MLESMFVILMLIAILLLVFAIVFEDNAFWQLTAITLSSALWFILALSTLEIEIPYEFYNGATGLIETGSHTYSNPYIVYIFALMGVLTTIYLVVMTFDKYITYKPKRR
jgi:hypothetical protein